ncbi:MAG: hypothetical protein E4G92_00135 [Bacteroidia bacterium]|nr:MAG: hypothetical protein E4G92_00135 [Bacteroidia bacterium]
MAPRLGTLSLVIFAVTFIFAGCLRNSGNVKDSNVIQPVVSDSLSTPSGSVQAARTAPDTSEESRLNGRWQRADGNYYLQIFSVSADSTLKAGYYNPNSVNVESGEWTRQEGILYIRIILRDVNYPGSIYILEYQPENDILAGNYFQAVDGVNYEVFFSRVK